MVAAVRVLVLSPGKKTGGKAGFPPHPSSAYLCVLELSSPTGLSRWYPFPSFLDEPGSGSRIFPCEKSPKEAEKHRDAGLDVLPACQPLDLDPLSSSPASVAARWTAKNTFAKDIHGISISTSSGGATSDIYKYLDKRGVVVDSICVLAAGVRPGNGV
ncbi:hypothetical protein VTK73DRAFT_4914 [Phialemonium thermophilum]|uniref:Uncharacterized protein n=1 Tax=Phialemonium thermophilum TaxID=223376 RepID=A0ABR3V4Y9_9PEZI